MSFARGIGGRTSGRRLIATARPFNGDFAALFPGAIMALQSDRGLTYGGQTLGAGTAPVTGSLTGALLTAPIPLLFKCTNAGVIGGGALFAAYADGVGLTPFMTNIAPAAGTPFALSGPGFGLSHAWAAGSALLDNTWTATCAALADQSGSGNNASRAGVAFQPVIAPGLNGHASVLWDGVNDTLDSALALPAPGTTPTFQWDVWRKITEPSGNSIQFGSSTGNSFDLFCNAVATNVTMYNGSSANSNSVVLNQWMCSELYWSNSAADYSRMGATTVAGGNAGNTAGVGGYQIGAGGGVRFSNMELLAHILVPYLPTAAQLAAANAAVASYYGGGVTL